MIRPSWKGVPLVGIQEMSSVSMSNPDYGMTRYKLFQILLSPILAIACYGCSARPCSTRRALLMWQSMIEGKMAPNNLQVFSAVRTCAFAASLLGTCVAGAVLSFPQTAFAGREATKINESGTDVRTMVPQEDLDGLRPPKARIEGGTRGRGSQGLLVLPLVPDHVGLTIAS